MFYIDNMTCLFSLSFPLWRNLKNIGFGKGFYEIITLLLCQLICFYLASKFL